MEATVLTYLRRQVKAYVNGKYYSLLIPRKLSEILPGDRVVFSEAETTPEILSIAPRKNVLQRSYLDKTKEIAANLDEIWITIAPSPLFNTSFVDRLLCLAELLQINAALILNKQDLDYSQDRPCIRYYEKLGLRIFNTQARGSADIIQLEAYLKNHSNRNIAVAGVSGVGKSSILQKLLSNTDIRIAEVSEKTGQGRQTTSLAEGYVYANNNFIFDLPGIQKFGIANIREDNVVFGFPDILEIGKSCEYSSCRHLQERNCVVRDAAENNVLLPSRYESYKQIISEIRAARPY